MKTLLLFCVVVLVGCGPVIHYNTDPTLPPTPRGGMVCYPQPDGALVCRDLRRGE